MNLTSHRAATARQQRMLSFLLSKTSFLAGRMAVEALTPLDARIYHFAVLAALEEFGPASQADLERRTGIDRSDMAAAVAELATQGYIDRAPDKTDRRRNVVTLTPAGREQLGRLDETLSRVQDELFAPLSPSERADLARLLTRVLDHHLPR